VNSKNSDSKLHKQEFKQALAADLLTIYQGLLPLKDSTSRADRKLFVETEVALNSLALYYQLENLPMISYSQKKVDVVKNNSKNHKLTTPDMAMVYHTVQNLREELGICQSGEPGSNYQTIKSNIETIIEQKDVGTKFFDLNNNPKTNKGYNPNTIYWSNPQSLEQIVPQIEKWTIKTVNCSYIF